jgi:beta-N-acetylhexosaminidase
MKLPLLTAFIIFLNSVTVRAQQPEFLAAPDRWVDSVFNSLTPDQRIAQLFMISAYSNKDLRHAKEIRELITKYNIGGLIWMQGGPVRQGKLANYFQSVAKTPLLFSIDGEWGLAMRLDSTPRYPKQMTLGAIQDDSLIYKMGRQIARECRRIGIHVNFAPVADVNNNPLNPVIGMRSFGEEKERVAQKAYMYMKGMQDEHVMANGKHFPGHGDTESDSHLTLPLIPHSAGRIDSLELYPFRYLFDRGLASIMVAHLSIPSLDTTRNLPSTLSSPIVTGLLKEKLQYKGLLFTDALSMKGVTKFFPPGTVEVMALKAGNDVMLFSSSVPKGIQEINSAIERGELSRESLDEKCKRVLKAKYWCGLNKRPSVVTRKITEQINTPESRNLIKRLAEESVTLLKNDNMLPLHQPDTFRILSVSFGDTTSNILAKSLSDFYNVRHISIGAGEHDTLVSVKLGALASSDLVLLQLTRSTIKPDNFYGVGARALKLIDSIATVKASVLVSFANPYLLSSFTEVKKFKAVVEAYENMPEMQEAVFQVMIGLRNSTGRLPVSTAHFPAGTSLNVSLDDPAVVANRKKYFLSRRFMQIDSIVQSGIDAHAYPGCQVVAVRDGKVIYQKAFGRFTYEPDAPEVNNATMYDLASLTKIGASSFALMKLAGEKKFDYRQTLGYYLPELTGTDKENLRIEEVLTHQAGLQPWIPFYLKTLDKKGKYVRGVYSTRQSENYPIQVADKLFAKKGYNDTVFSRVASSKLVTPGKYVYSDLGYYFMQRIIERQTGKPLNEYVHDLLAAAGIGLRYQPLKYFSLDQITPTELDKKFRKQLVRGYVHDPGAALCGGVAGHAGLFGNALDVARLMQLYVNYGRLNGVRHLDSAVVQDFTSCHFCPGNRRGLCFEKPEPDLKKESPVTSECSLESFGHSGFTGTFAWADPKNKLVIVFLSNRVYPDAADNKLVKLGIRGRIHKAFYDALKEVP